MTAGVVNAIAAYHLELLQGTGTAENLTTGLYTAIIYVIQT